MSTEAGQVHRPETRVGASFFRLGSSHGAELLIGSGALGIEPALDVAAVKPQVAADAKCGQGIAAAPRVLVDARSRNREKLPDLLGGEEWLLERQPARSRGLG